MRCPTFTFKNKNTGESVTINQADYNDGRYQYITGLKNIYGWERVKESGGDVGGYEASRSNSDIAIMIKDKRSKDNIGQKVVFN